MFQLEPTSRRLYVVYVHETGRRVATIGARSAIHALEIFAESRGIRCTIGNHANEVGAYALDGYGRPTGLVYRAMSTGTPAPDE